MIKVVKTTLLFILIWAFFWFINNGFNPDLDYSQLQTLIFAVTTVILIKRNTLRLATATLAIILLIIMALLSVSFPKTIDAANFFGTLGFGILIISSLFYIPQLIKQGFIKTL